MQYFQHKKRFLTYALLALIVLSCQEPYDIEELDNSKSIPVFEGGISDQPGPYTISLSWSKSFNASNWSKPNPITNAQSVFIYDDNGGKEKLTSLKNGKYVTSNTMVGVIGRTYHLYVKLANGFIYESIPTKLLPAKDIDSLYAEPGSYSYSTKNGLGDLIVKTYEGIYVYADIITGTDETSYYKFNNRLIWQTTRLFQPVGAIPSTWYFRKVSNPDNLPNVKASVLYNGNQVVKKHQILFIPYVPDNSNGIDSLNLSAYTNMGWIVLSTTTSISKEMYNYYGDVAKQLKAGSQLFDPIPTQIKGNIICRSDTTQLALGLFEVTTKSTRNKGFYWMPGDDKVKMKNIFDPGPFFDDTSKGAPAPYWFDVYFKE